MKNLLLTFVMVACSANNICAQDGPSESFMSNLEAATDLADGRGFMKGKGYSADGSLIISKMNGNAQYSYDISTMSMNGVKLGLSLNYNQNASYTAFKDWKEGDGSFVQNHWRKFTQNRPLWVFGVGGFAVQPLTMCSRPFIHGDLRFDDSTYGSYPMVPDYDDQDMVWALDGWDWCNRMHALNEFRVDGNAFEDVIRLLRADGSTLVLHRASYRSGSPSRNSLQNDSLLVTGTYLTTDANSNAYALVTIDRTIVSQEQYVMLASNPGYGSFDDVPALNLPRRVEYFPGDGTSFVFHEWITPYGPEFYSEKYAQYFGAWIYFYRWKEAGLSPGDNFIQNVAGPTTFYLDTIKYNGTTLLTFDYNGQRWGERGTGSPMRGRAMLNGFDGHTFKWELGGVEINALGKRTYVRTDSALYGGHVDSSSIAAGWRPRPSETIVNSLDEYMSWSGLVTQITDAANRKVRFEYEPFTKAYLDTEFPRSSGGSNEATLTLTSMRLTATVDDAIRKEIKWLWEDSLQQPNVNTYSIDPGHVVYPRESQMVQSVTSRHPFTLDSIRKADYSSTSVITEDLINHTTTEEHALYGRTNLGSISKNWRSPQVTSSVIFWQATIAGDRRTSSKKTYACVGMNTSDTTLTNIYLPTEQIDSVTYRGLDSIMNTHSTFRRTWVYERTPDAMIAFADIDSANRPRYIHKFGHAVLSSTETGHVRTDTGWQAYTKSKQEFAHFPRQEDTVIIDNPRYLHFPTLQKFLVWCHEQRALNSGIADRELEIAWINMTPDSSFWVPDPNGTDTAWAVSAPLHSVPTTTTVYDPLHANRIVARTVNTIDTNRFTMSGGGYETNTRLGKTLAVTVYNRDLTETDTTFIEYEATVNPYGRLFLPYQTTNFLKAISRTWHHPYAWPDWATGGKVVGTRVRNDAPHSSARNVNDTVRVLDVGTRSLEVPTLTETLVRKFIPTSSTTVSVDTTRLRRAMAATYFGLTSRILDENGYVTDYDYDGIGRLKMAWLPGDYPLATTDEYEWPYIDGVDTLRRMSIRYGSSQIIKTVIEIAFTHDCDSTPVPYPDSLAADEQLDTSSIHGIAAGYHSFVDLPRGPSYYCSYGSGPQVQEVRPGKHTEQVQDIWHGQPLGAPFPVVVDFVSEEAIVADNAITIIPWEVTTLSSALLKFKISKLKGVSSQLTVKAYWDETEILDTTRIVVDDGGAAESEDDFDFAYDVTSALNTYCDNDTLAHVVRITISADDASNSRVDFSDVWLELNGTFKNFGNRPAKDFTIAIAYKDGTSPEMSTFSKIDDVHTTMDSSQLEYHDTKSRRAIRHTLFDHDYLPKENRWNYYDTAVGAFGAPSTDYDSKTTAQFDGLGKTLSVINPLGLQSSTTYDLVGRPVLTNPGGASLGFYNIAATPTSDNALDSTKILNTYDDGPPSDFNIPTAWQGEFYGHCTRTVTQIGIASSTTAGVSRTATFTDALGRTILSVQAYHEPNFDDGCTYSDVPDRNLVTRFRYDNQNRTTHVWNPAGQLMRYWYDTWGRIKYVYQTDQGFTSYAYDKLGRVRFSQTQDQSDRSAVMYREYDDLGRLLVLGEAIVGIPPTVPDSGWANTYGTIENLPDTLGLGRITDILDPHVLHVDTTSILTANPTLWKVPQRAIPVTSHDSNFVVGSLCDDITTNASD
ncbi:MAG: hypothetical protein SGJ05_12080, partial [bacterium]|nr:hypothetical protein [bacterium]